MSKTIAQLLVDVLHEAGARDIFGVTGDAINPFVNAVVQDKRVRWLGVRHEENAAYAASAQSLLTGKIGVCAGTAGPGALHLINGLYNAQKEGAAVVAITGQVARSERGSDFHKEMDLTKVFDDVCAYQAIIDSADQVPRMVEIAVQKALVERVVTRIEIPIDLIGKQMPSTHFLHPLYHQPPRVLPSDEQIDKAAEILNQAKRPTLFCGLGCLKAKEAVIALANKIEAPIVHTLRAKPIFDCQDNRVMGMTGNLGNPAGLHAIKDADALVMLGTDFPYTEFLPDGIPIIQVDHHIDHIGRRAPVTLGIVSEVKATVDKLMSKLESKSSSPFLSALIQMRDKWLNHISEQGSLEHKETPLRPQIIVKALNDIASQDAIMALDVGECTVWVAHHMNMDHDREMVSGFNHGAIGVGLPVALGAQALDPKREVWAICGDGGFGMSMNDFVTAVRFNWPIKVIVLNNSELGFVKMEMEVSGIPYSKEATGLLNPDFAAFAKACGGDGVTVTTVDEILPALEQAKRSDKPFIIDAKVNAGTLVMPPDVHLKEAWGFGMGKIKEGLLGLKGDHQIWQVWRDEFYANLK